MTHVCPNISQMQIEQHSQVKRELQQQQLPCEPPTRSQTKEEEERQFSNPL